MLCLVIWAQINLDVPSKKEAFKVFTDFMKHKGFSEKGEVLSRKSFMRLWNSEFPHCKTSKRKSIYFKCQVCEDLKVRLGPRQVTGKARHASRNFTLTVGHGEPLICYRP